MRKVSAIIPTFNEAENIKKAIESVRFADEIIVVDSYSTDKTPEIATNLGVSVIQHEYVYSAAQKNWIIPQVKHEWIFLLDADEVASPMLLDEIQSILNKTEIEEDAFWINRTNMFLGKPVKYSGWQRDKVIRLFKRDTCRYEDKHVHAEIITGGKIGVLQNRIIHYTYKSMDHYIKKMNQYAIWKANQFHLSNKKPNLFHFIVKPIFRFIKNYFVDLGILDGFRGLIICSLNAYGVFLRYAILLGLRKE